MGYSARRGFTNGKNFRSRPSGGASAEDRRYAGEND